MAQHPPGIIPGAYASGMHDRRSLIGRVAREHSTIGDAEFEFKTFEFKTEKVYYLFLSMICP